jgi:hypothetical protein
LPNALRDARLEARAVVSRWPIRPDCRQAVVTRQLTIALDPNSTAREASVAERVLLSADGLNLDQEKQAREDLLEQLLSRLEHIYNLTPKDPLAGRNGHVHTNGATR